MDRPKGAGQLQKMRLSFSISQNCGKINSHTSLLEIASQFLMRKGHAQERG